MPASLPTPSATIRLTVSSPKGVIQWVSASPGQAAGHGAAVQIACHEGPRQGDRDFMAHINPGRCGLSERAWIEPSLAQATPEQGFQFEREVIRGGPL